uniref:alpha-1,3-arabinosyltransferase XAT2-like n=1 Tax=Erigeron canadensis TaxID=72917 RepID=UPI001CB95EF7|nr:alpha-1,3-arabinosyltransferase XAT2-like [Erigeron canadensis]
MEGHRRVVCGATQIIGLLTFIYLFYTQSFGFDPIKLWLGTRNLLKFNARMEELAVICEDTSHQSFKSLIGDADDLQKLETTGFACDSTVHSLVCVASNPVKINTKTMNIYMPRQLISTKRTNYSIKDEVIKGVQVRPYAWAQYELLKNVTPVNFLQQPPQSPELYCDYNYTIPAVVFSSGGFAGNLFHEFNEIIIPLFMTTRLFKSRVKFILVDYNPYLVTKYTRIFSSLSNYNVLNPSINTSVVHCFPGVVVGLKFHNYLSINSSEVPKGNSMLEFKKFLQTTYGLKITNVTNTGSTTPTLILVSRRKTRLFLNEDEMVDMMEDLGFEVLVVRSNKKMSNLDKFAKVVNTASVLVGTHGAGLTNQVFLPSGAVVVQVVPLALEWPSSVYFGGPAVGMGLHYLDYKIGPDESSLIESYPRSDPVISDPGSVFAKGYYVGKEMYLDKQNIRVDVNRFKGTLVEALKLLGRI